VCHNGLRTMKLTKYPQSCLKLEHAGQAVLVDVGTLATAEFRLADFGRLDAVLYTHSHADHFDAALLPELAQAGVALYGNSNVAEAAGGTKIEIIEDGEELVVAGFKVRAIQMEHCLMTDGSPAGIPNTGFLINDQLLLPGDSTDDPGIKVKILAVPIFGPDISPRDAFSQMQATAAAKVIPVHYDVAGINPEVFAMFAKLGGTSLETEIITLDNGEAVEL
jgi:L-ascorbate metabolism protein UlaG (beta-lactamase superfamily)